MGEPIHSGHFMTSDPHTDPNPDEEDDNEVDVEALDVEDEPKIESSSQRTSRSILQMFAEKPVTFYKFGPRKTQSIAIDVSLNKLNKCIKVAYNKMTTPKWKDFKGLRLHWKQRIRLNNVIWRAYYMEFRRPQDRADRKPVEKKKYCYFSVPDDDNTHAKIEGTLIEGMYWKRRMEAVKAQYKCWRHFFRNRKPEARRKRERAGPQRGQPAAPPMSQRSQTPQIMSTAEFDSDEFENIFTDELFASLNQPYMFPHPSEMMQMGCADIMQPGLLSLQPSLQEIMSSLDGSELSVPSTSANGDDMFDEPSSNDMVVVSKDEHVQKRPTSIDPNMTYSHFAEPSLPMMHRDPQTTNSDYSMNPTPNLVMDFRSQRVRNPESRESSNPEMNISTNSASSYGTIYGHASTWKTTTTVNNQNSSYMVTGGDVGQIDYSSPFTGHIGASRLTQPMPPPAQSLGGVPWSRTSINASWIEQQLASPTLQVLTPVRHSPSPSLPSPSVLSPLQLSHSLALAAQGIPSTSVPEIMRASNSMYYNNDIRNETRTPVFRRSASESQAVIHDAPKSSVLTMGMQALPISNPTSLPPNRKEFSSSPNFQASCLRAPAEWSEAQSANTSQQQFEEKPSWQLLSDHLATSVTSAASSTTKNLKVAKSEPNPVVHDEKKINMEAADSTLNPFERKRILHLHAEQNRRTALKDGFEQLSDLIPDLFAGGMKPTNAVILAKAADHIRNLISQKDTAKRDKREMLGKIDELNKRIQTLQTTLPTASPRLDGSTDPKLELVQFIDRYTKERTKQNWNFGLLTKLLHPMLLSFASRIHPDGSNRNELSHSAALFFCEEWKVQKLRPLASELLVYLATNTPILKDPTSLENHIRDLNRL